MIKLNLDGLLLKAVKAGDVTLAMIYLESGADPDGLDPETGGNLLHVAIEFEHTGELAKLLIEAGADIDAVHSRFGTTPAMYAARSNLPALALLIEKGADLDRKDIWGQPTLKWASTSEAAEMIKRSFKQLERQVDEALLSAFHDTAAKRQADMKRFRTKVKIVRPS